MRNCREEEDDGEREDGQWRRAARTLNEWRRPNNTRVVWSHEFLRGRRSPGGGWGPRRAPRVTSARDDFPSPRDFLYLFYFILFYFIIIVFICIKK